MLKVNALKKGDIGNPIVPKNAADPAAQFTNLRSSNRQLKARYKRIIKGVKQLIGSFEKRIISTNIKYLYQIDANRFQSINLFLQRLLYGELLDGQGQLQERWWLSAHLDQAYIDSTSDVLQSSKNIATVASVGPDLSREMRSIRLEQMIFSRGFQTRVGLVQARTFELMTGLSDSTRTDLSNTLARGMVDGLGIRELTKNTVERVGVSFSRAQRIVRTETLNAYRTAGGVETDELNEDVYGDSEWGMQTLWFSALAPTSRRWHIARHGLLYTTKEVREFYAKNGNPINCLCSQSTVLVNKKTGEVLQSSLIKRMKKKREAAMLILV